MLSGPHLFPFGPFVAAVVVASTTQGRAGVMDLIARCLRWRVGVGWYAAALLVPAAIALTTFAIAVASGAPARELGAWRTLIVLFPAAMIDAPLWEESGWRGYALPRFPADRSRLANTLLLAVLLAGWHLPIALGGGGAVVVPYLIATVGSAVVTNWVYYGAGGSALLAILYHAAANTAGMFCAPISSGPGAATSLWSLAAVNGVVAAAVICAGGLLRPVERVDHP